MPLGRSSWGNTKISLYDEFSDSVFEGFTGESFSFQGNFTPGFLAGMSSRQWTVDGVGADETGGTITFPALKTVSDVYTIGLTTSVVQSQGIRQALRDIWNISPLDSPEIRFSTSAQVELMEPGFAQGPLQGSQKYLAAIVSYIPASVIFSFRVLLSVALMLFTASVLFALLPERAPVSFLRRRRE